MRLGAHVSIEGSFAEAPRRALELGCECFQIFAGPPRLWGRAAPGAEEAEEFRRLVRERDLHPVVVHAGYLAHLASRRSEVARRARRLCREELEIARELGAQYYVVHAGSAAGRSPSEVAEVLAEELSALAGADGPMVLVENTASAASSIGSRFEDLGALMERLDRGRFGVAFDPAHAVGAGYDLSTAPGVAKALSALYRSVGRTRVRLVHANDSRALPGSGRDLHEAVGRGAVGEEGFRALLADATLSGLPFILETPLRRPGDDARNLAALRRLAGASVGRRRAGRVRSSGPRVQGQAGEACQRSRGRQ